MVVFDWVRWRAEVSDPTALGGADVLTLRKLLTFHVRADRFSEGHLISAFEKGHITAILRRLADSPADGRSLLNRCRRQPGFQRTGAARPWACTV